MATEQRLIDAFVSSLPHPPSPRGPGDDAAVVPPQTRAACVTTDACVEGVHFTRPFFSLEDVGHKALAANLSDLAAMGATPTWWLASLGLPKDFTPQQLKRLAAGMRPLARAAGLSLIGGNLTASPQLSITLTLAGAVSRPLLRSGAKPGDWLYLGGTLGDAAAGLRLRHQGGLLTRAQRRPMPQLKLGQLAARFASAAIDVSDGLASDAGHVATASKVAIDLWSSALPISPALKAFAGPRAVMFAVHGGEDYALLVAVPHQRKAAFEAACRKAKLKVANIGRCRQGRGLTLDGAALAPHGFDHFR